MKSKKELILSLFTLGLFLMILCPWQTFAQSWEDDWLNSITTNSGGLGFYDGQKRGYMSAGSFSARWPMDNTTDYPLTIQKPRIKAGCGGLDILNGGFAFLGFEQLVKKLQAILMNAPALLFDIALKVLAEAASTSMKALDNIIELLNSIQMDECKMSDSIIRMTGLDDLSAAAKDKVGSSQFLSNINTKVARGMDDFYTGMKEGLQSTGLVPEDDVSRMSQDGCSQEIKNVFLGDYQGALLLQKIGHEKLGMPQDYIDLMRGLVGDLRIGSDREAFRVTHIDPCPKSDGTSVEAFMKGEMSRKDQAGNCHGSTSVDLRTYFENQMIDIAARMEDQIMLTEEQNAFINSNPIPVQKIIQMAIGTDLLGSTLGMTSEVVAKAHAYHMASDFYHRIIFIIQKGKHALAAESHPPVGAHADTCNIEVWATQLDDGMLTMQETLLELTAQLKADYNRAVNEAKAHMTLVYRWQGLDDQLKGYVLSTLGATMDGSFPGT